MKVNREYANKGDLTELEALELTNKAKNGDESAFEEIRTRLRPFFFSWFRYDPMSLESWEDLESIWAVYLWKTTQAYDSNRGKCLTWLVWNTRRGMAFRWNRAKKKLAGKMDGHLPVSLDFSSSPDAQGKVVFPRKLHLAEVRPPNGRNKGYSLDARGAQLLSTKGSFSLDGIHDKLDRDKFFSELKGRIRKEFSHKRMREMLLAYVEAFEDGGDVTQKSVAKRLGVSRQRMGEIVHYPVFRRIVGNTALKFDLEHCCGEI